LAAPRLRISKAGRRSAEPRGRKAAIGGQAEKGRIATFPAWLKWALTFFVLLFVATHAWFGNSVNFLWLCDTALFGALVALWSGNRLVASMSLLAVLLADGVGWTFDFLVAAVTGWHPLGATLYMFDPHVPALVRGLSLFHLWLPGLLLWMVSRLGYDRRALRAQTLLTWVLLPVSYAVTTPERNLNWVLGFGHVQTAVPAGLYLLGEMAVFPLVFYLPVHLVLRRLWSRQ
jgi:hypothetical protein